MSAQKRRRISPREKQAAPLHRLSADAQARIAWQVAQPEPPPRWLGLGPLDEPRPLMWVESRGWYEWHWQRGIALPKRERLPDHLRAAVIARDGYVCQLCGGDIEPDDLHIDHVIPYSKGGDHSLSNLQASHSLCNLKKGARV